MHSLRTRITLLAVFVIVIAVIVVTMLSVLFIRQNEHHQSDQLMLMLCESGERNLDYFFTSVQKSVDKFADHIQQDLDGLESNSLESHMSRMERYLAENIYLANGVLTYYYRIDPAVSDTVQGFWYTNLDGEGFELHQLTDITRYDTQDTSQLVWFTVPKQTGKGVWLPPYITDNLDVRVISYNKPLYCQGQFIGVVGIEIDFSTLAELVSSIRLYNSGYAFVCDETGKLFYHPLIDVSQLTEETAPRVPLGLTTASTFLRYTFDGVEKQAVWLPLCNGMRLTVAVPMIEAEGRWMELIREIMIVSGVVLLGLSLFVLYYTGRITRPLEELTQAAEKVDKGLYDFSLDYERDDEVGRLTKTFKHLADSVKEHIIDLNKRVYVDALTSVKNKGAFTTAIDVLDQKIAADGARAAFAIGVFDCDNLKAVNDRHGHDKGDIYLKNACALICRVFQHSPVFRTGGDEFAVILQNDDYLRRDILAAAFDREAEAINAAHENKWEQVHIAMGVTTFDPRQDSAAMDTVRRADKIMYETKRLRKTRRQDAKTPA